MATNGLSGTNSTFDQVPDGFQLLTPIGQDAKARAYLAGMKLLERGKKKPHATNAEAAAAWKQVALTHADQDVKNEASKLAEFWARQLPFGESQRGRDAEEFNKAA